MKLSELNIDKKKIAEIADKTLVSLNKIENEINKTLISMKEKKKIEMFREN